MVQNPPPKDDTGKKLIKAGATIMAIQNLLFIVNIFSFIDTLVDEDTGSFLSQTNFFWDVTLKIDMIGMLLMGIGFYLRAKIFADRAQNFQIAGGCAIGWVVVTFIWRILLIGNLSQIEDDDSFEAFFEAVIGSLILILVGSILLFISGLYIRNTLQGGGSGFFAFSLLNFIGSAPIALSFASGEFVVFFLVKIFILPIVGIIIFLIMALAEDRQIFFYPVYGYQQPYQQQPYQQQPYQQQLYQQQPYQQQPYQQQPYQQQPYQQQPYQQQPYQQQPYQQQPPQQPAQSTPSYSPPSSEKSDGMDADPAKDDRNATKALDKVTCVSCGAEDDGSAVFCGTCGTKLKN
ncbi:MAG: hypothetical protein ACXAB7_03505 [Candidatus Kariarchaeaceae archaeon]|jgi:hypothetical protein